MCVLYVECCVCVCCCLHLHLHLNVVSKSWLTYCTGREVDSVLRQYQRFVKPAFNRFIAPTLSAADIVVPRGRENRNAIAALCNHIATLLVNAS